jgi:hypothetical protein
MTDLKFGPLVDEAVELGLALAQPPPQLTVRAAQLFVLAAHLTHTQHQKLKFCVPKLRIESYMCRFKGTVSRDGFGF